MEDFYGYPAPTSPGLLRSLRKVVFWPEKVRRVFRGREILPWRGQGRLLDVGCGPGGNLAMFQEQGWDVYGVEMSPAAVARARDRVGDRIHAGTLETAPFAEESFDVILFSHSLEHLFSPADTLAHARRLLKPEGMIVVTVPNAGSLETWVFGRWWVPWDPPRHLYHFVPGTLGRLLERCGFRVTRLRTGVGSLFFMASLERVWEHRWNRRLPARRFIEKLVARPFCLAAGHLGYGTEITVHAVKQG
jgi:SAM-dependent methyltransferase